MCGMPGTLTPKDPEALKRSLRAQGVPESAFQNQTAAGGTANSREAWRGGGYQAGGSTIGGANAARVMLSGTTTSTNSALKTLLGQ